MTGNEALDRAQQWADGRLSNLNEMMRLELDVEQRQVTLALTDFRDAQEVVKWSALAMAAAALDYPRMAHLLAEEPISTHPERVGEEIGPEVADERWSHDEEAVALGVELADIEEVLAAPVPGKDGEPPLPPIARHPQVPEHDWTALNHAQKNDVNERLWRIEKINGVLDKPDAHPTDRAAAEAELATALGALREDYAFELLPAEDIEKADAAFVDEPPPVRVGPNSPPMAGTELERRRRYLLAKQGLPAEAEQDRREELAEIDARLARRL